MNKTFNLSIDVLAELEHRKKTSYDSLLRELLAMPQIPQKILKNDEHPDFIALKALKIGESVVLLFERPTVPEAMANGREMTSSESKQYFRDMKPLNLRHLSQVVRRAEERLGYKLFVEGTYRGQLVMRVA